MRLCIARAREIIGLLKENGSFGIPVQLESLADIVNIKIWEYPLLTLEGYLFIYKEQKHLLYNPSVSNVQNRFTIAHEIGHVVLEHPTAINTNPTANSKLKYDREADRFAEEILMPLEEFKISYKYYLRGTPEHLKPRLLARKFKVSCQAAALRVRRLKLDIE